MDDARELLIDTCRMAGFSLVIREPQNSVCKSTVYKIIEGLGGKTLFVNLDGAERRILCTIS